MGGGLISLLTDGCASSVYFARFILEGEGISLAKSEFTVIGKGRTKQRKFVLVKSEKYPFPIYVFKHNEEKYSALLLECTHKGCELVPHGEFLTCPCHGSEFTNTGRVQNPPAEQNLQTFNVTIKDETIFIKL